MRHLHSGRKLGVAPDHRRALLRSLTLALIEKEAIQTIPSRAKELRWWADQVITLAKRGDLASRRQLVRLLGSTQTYTPGENRARQAVEKAFNTLGPRFKTRTGGYTQIFRLTKRRVGDNAEQCIMRYIPDEADEKASGKSKKGAKRGPNAKAQKLAAPTKEKKPAKAEEKAAKAPEDKPAKSKKKKEE
jgi:large subunit ribosomal protein L17